MVTSRQLTKSQFKKLLRHYGIDPEPQAITLLREDFYRVMRRAFQAGRDCDVMQTTLPLTVASAKQKERKDESQENQQ